LTEAAPGRSLNDYQVAVLTTLVDDLFRAFHTKRSSELDARAIRVAMRQARLGKALREVIAVLPEMLNDREIVGDEVDHATAMVDAAEWLLKNGPISDAPRSGQHGQRWHAAARLIAEHTIRALRVNGQPAPSHQTKDGPVVHVVALALHHIQGSSPSHDTIAKQLQRAPPASVKLKGRSVRPAC
jgi:hypothetical protein